MWQCIMPPKPCAAAPAFTNIDYLGLLTLLRHLLALGLVSDSETKKIAARLHVDMDADIAIFL